MLHDLDKTLETLLGDPAPAEVASSEVRFDTPEKNYGPQQTETAINLFLYEVQENRELRDPVPIREDAGHGVSVRRRPPIRVDCAYLVTTWSKSQTRLADEHQLLGLTFAWLSRFPEIPARCLEGSLVGQPFPPPSLIAQWDSARNVGEFWTALGIAPRPYFNLIVTIAMDLDLHSSSPQVTTITTDVLPLGTGAAGESLAGIGGYALDLAAGAPVAVRDAVVNLETVGGGALKSARSDATGRFVFDGLVPGNYRIWGVAPGRAPTPAQPIQIPSPNGAYVLRF